VNWNPSLCCYIVYMIKPKTAHIVIPLSVIAVAAVGGMFSASGMEWYRATLVKPDITPPDWAFPLAWNTIFILTALSAMIAWERTAGSVRRCIFTVFVLNGVLNAAWSLLFFRLELIGAAFAEMLALLATILLLIGYLWRRARISAALLLPYAIWVTFAAYLTFLLLRLNG